MVPIWLLRQLRRKMYPRGLGRSSSIDPSKSRGRGSSSAAFAPTGVGNVRFLRVECRRAFKPPNRTHVSTRRPDRSRHRRLARHRPGGLRGGRRARRYGCRQLRQEKRGPARAVADAIVAKGGKADVEGFDVADSSAVNAGVDALVKRHGKIDVLIANAGIVKDRLLWRLKDAEFEDLWATNVRGAIACARAASKSMMRGRWGRMVFVSSVVGEMGNAGQTAYAATKAALIGAARSIAREYASRNVTSNVVAPGFIDTDMTVAFTAE